MSQVNKIVLAYSGGLDTSVICRWLVENYDAEVITFTADLGQEEELGGLEEKARSSGAVKAHIVECHSDESRNVFTNDPSGVGFLDDT